MSGNKSMATGKKELTIKLQTLREKLLAGEKSQVIKSFGGDKFIESMHEKYIE